MIDIISFLPWIWEKTATKLGFFLLKANPAYLKNFSTALEKIQTDIHVCESCFWYTDSKDNICQTCNDLNRDRRIICVVEDYLDYISIEKLRIFRGQYHILWWAISPVNWVLASDLHFEELFIRIAKWDFEEVIVATNPNIEWEATYMYLKENIPNKGLKITRLSKWLPNSWYIEYADEITLINAFKWRS